MACCGAGCRYFKQRPIADEAIARVGEQYLYRSQLHDLMAQSNQVADQDSTQLAAYHIKQWAIAQLLTATADSLPPDRQQFIEQQVAEYRRSLLRYEDEKQLSAADTTIADTTLNAYYAQHADEWKLKQHALKATYMVTDRKAPEQFLPRKMFFEADTDTVIKHLQTYCAQYGNQCQLNPQWMTWNELRQLMPLPKQNTENFIRQKKYETTDSIYSYWLRISDRAAEGTTAPIEYCRPQLRDALRHQQRHHNLQEILQQRYQKALEQGMVEVF